MYHVCLCVRNQTIESLAVFILHLMGMSLVIVCINAGVSVVSPGGSQGFLETSQTPTIVCSTVQLARYSLGAIGTELSQ